MDLTIGSSRCKLPSPVEDSNVLKARAIEIVEVWHEKYSAQHPEIRAAYLHLTDVAGLVPKVSKCVKRADGVSQ